MPFFSIIVPTYNRATLVRRALDSALSQDYTDFELIVVDSASTDGTPDVVRDYAARDPRVRLICESDRRGVCPARNTGIDAASGEWIVCLDSDDELPPGTLATFRAKIAENDASIAHLRFMCRRDDGSLIPQPPLIEEVWGYEEFLRFLDRVVDQSGETMSCIRADTFAVFRFPEDRSYETEYHLDFCTRYKTRTYPIVARLYHLDAEDQNSFVPNPNHWLRVAPDNARSYDRILEKHGAALQRVAPRAYAQFLRGAAKFHFLAGNRRRALRLVFKMWRRDPFSARGWGLAAFGALGPRPTAWADAWKARVRRALTNR